MASFVLPQGVAHNDRMKLGPSLHAGERSSTIRDRYRWPAAVLLLCLLMACSAGVNDELAATMTPYPVRSRVDADRSVVATPNVVVELAISTAEAAARGGDAAASAATFDVAVGADPSNVEARLGRALARARAGDPDGARLDADAAVVMAPDRPGPYLTRAAVARRRADFASAGDDYRKAIALDPANTNAFVGRGEVALLVAQGEPGRYQGALDDFTRALALDPGSVAARLGRARVFADRAAFRGDAADLDRATIELEALPAGTGGESATLVRARLLAARGDHDGARRVLDAPVVRRIDETGAATGERDSARAAVAVAANDWDAAVAAAAAAIAADPASWEAHRTLANAHLRRGDPAAALAASDAILARWTDDGPSLYLRGAALRALDRPTEARAALESARRRLAASPVYQARISQLETAG